LILINGKSLPEKLRLPVAVLALCSSLAQVGQHTRNQNGILDRFGGKSAELRLMSAPRRHAKNNAQ
jgi:hypothetical protein